MNILEQLGYVAVAVERGVELVKKFLPYNTWSKTAKYQKHIDTGLAVAGNVGVCYLWNVNLLAAVGIDVSAVAGTVATGLIASFGSTVAHEVIKFLEMLRKGASQQAAG